MAGQSSPPSKETKDCIIAVHSFAAPNDAQPHRRTKRRRKHPDDMNMNDTISGAHGRPLKMQRESVAETERVHVAEEPIRAAEKGHTNAVEPAEIVDIVPIPFVVPTYPRQFHRTAPETRLPAVDMPLGQAPVSPAPGGILDCQCGSRDTCQCRYKLSRLVIVVDEVATLNNWLGFEAVKDNVNFHWNIENLDSVHARNLLYYEPDEIVVRFERPRRVDQDDIGSLAVLRAKLFDVMNILNKMRPETEKSRPKIEFTGKFSFWFQRLPRVELRESLFYHEFLLVPLIAHWRWKDAAVFFPKDTELLTETLYLGESWARLETLLESNRQECERHLLDGRMYIPPGMSEAEMNARKEELKARDQRWMDHEERQHKSQHLQSIRMQVCELWQPLLTNYLFKSRAPEVLELASHIVRSQNLSVNDAFSVSSVSLPGPVGMKGYVYVENGLDDLPELLSSRKLRDLLVEFSLLYHDRDEPLKGKDNWKRKKKEDYFAPACHPPPKLVFESRNYHAEAGKHMSLIDIEPENGGFWCVPVVLHCDTRLPRRCPG
ncbi:hypothetical protein QBC43DRAFT_374407 [Cladorrhinum sp. PSN259]|nr:hypothetical protein QBC43DRAFT_374407 [Cladorrhinum sp. PSN259]